MVESGQAPIRRVDFDSRLHARLPVEVAESREILARVGADYLEAPQRPSFHLFLLMRSTKGSHTVDFAEIPARPGRLIEIRPGQIQVWSTEPTCDATLVLAEPATALRRPWFPGHSSSCDLDGVAMATAEKLIEALRLQQAGFGGDEPTSRLMLALFDGLAALFDQAAGAADAPHSDVYVAFRSALEDDLSHRHEITDYARRLGYSARTISRACQEATGQTAKRVLTDRLVLEAKRLLIHTDAPAARISAQLGFSEPTNFTKFFTRNTTQSPTSFRHLHRRR